MKKLFIAALALVLSLNAHAQFGIVGGLTSTASTFKAAQSEFEAKTINNYHVGFTYKLSLGNLLAIQPALIYNVKGAKIEDLRSVADIDFKTGYLELPVQIQAGFGLLNVARVYAFAEPFIGYALTNEIDLKAGITQLNNTDWDVVKNRLEYGVGLGAGVELFKHVQVALKYYWNMGSIYGGDIDFNGVKKTIAESNCSGISLTAAILF